MSDNLPLYSSLTTTFSSPSSSSSSAEVDDETTCANRSEPQVDATKIEKEKKEEEEAGEKVEQVEKDEEAEAEDASSDDVDDDKNQEAENSNKLASSKHRETPETMISAAFSRLLTRCENGLKNIDHISSTVKSGNENEENNDDDDANFRTAAAISSAIDFENWYRDDLQPILQQRSAQKSLECAFEQQKLAQTYLDMIRISSGKTPGQYVDDDTTKNSIGDIDAARKAIDALNRAIRLAPSDEYRFLARCFSLRSRAHSARRSYESALLDNEYSLRFQALSQSVFPTSSSSSIIKLRVWLLEKLNRPAEAYRCLRQFLSQINHFQNDEDEKVSHETDSRRRRRRRRINYLRKKLLKLQYEMMGVDTEKVNQSSTAKSFDSASDNYFIQINRHVKMCRAESGSDGVTIADRFGFVATGSIDKNSVILREQPTLFALKQDGYRTRCATCVAECADRFYPCPACSDAIFCSTKCANVAISDDRVSSLLSSSSSSSSSSSGSRFLLREHHRNHECGFVRMLEAIDARAHAAQVWQFLRMCSPQLLIKQQQQQTKVEEEIEEEDGGEDDNFRLDNFFNQLISSPPLKSVTGSSSTSDVVTHLSIDTDYLRSWFARSQINLRRFVRSRSSGSAARSPGKFAKAIFLLGLYAHRYPAELGFIRQNFQHLLSLITEQLAACGIFEYAWNVDKNENCVQGSATAARLSIAGFQCLFGSRVGHACGTGCNARWFFDGTRFALQSIKPIEPGETIAISFGIDTRSTPSMFDRLAMLQRQYLILCACPDCLVESRRHFALRCQYCAGPIPWNATRLPANRRCLRCERVSTRDSESLDPAMIERRLRSATYCIALLNEKDHDNYVDQNQISTIENEMCSLANVIDLRNRQFLETIEQLCERYIAIDRIGLAIEWKNWFASIDIDDVGLPSEIDDRDTEETSDDNDKDSVIKLLNRFAYLDRWIAAYMKHIERLSLSTSSKTSLPKPHIEQTAASLERMQTTIEKWHRLSETKNEILLVEDIGDEMNRKFSNFAERLAAICRKHLINFELINAITDSATDKQKISGNDVDDKQIHQDLQQQEQQPKKKKNKKKSFEIYVTSTSG